jgi:hypothetical protein
MRFEIRVFTDRLDVVHVASSPTELLQKMFEAATRAEYPMQSTVSIKGSIYVSTWTFSSRTDPSGSWDRALSAVVSGLRYYGMDFVVVDGTTAPPLREPGEG